MNIQFTKMHALGNDFMVVDGVNQALQFTREQIVAMGNRRRGIGFDQLLMIEPASNSCADFSYRIFNADGNEVEQCGNGARCMARFIYENGLSNKASLKLQTSNRLISVERLSSNCYRASLDVPIIESASRRLSVTEAHYDVGIVSVGNPHAVLIVENIDEAPVSILGPLFEKHPHFPSGTNVEFMTIESSERVNLKVWERNTGETPACGSGAAGAVIIGRARNLLAPKVNVRFPGGELTVEWKGEGEPVYLVGEASIVYEGNI